MRTTWPGPIFLRTNRASRDFNWARSRPDREVIEKYSTLKKVVILNLKSIFKNDLPKIGLKSGWPDNLEPDPGARRRNSALQTMQNEMQSNSELIQARTHNFWSFYNYDAELANTLLYENVWIQYCHSTTVLISMTQHLKPTLLKFLLSIFRA